jgi:hypothetical protein
MDSKTVLDRDNLKSIKDEMRGELEKVAGK